MVSTGTPALFLAEPCGSSIIVSQDGRSASRRNACNDFDNGIVLTSQPLDDDQVLSFTVGNIVATWAGSVQLGVTTSDPRSIRADHLPSTAPLFMGSTTWLYSGTCIMHNGKRLIKEYGSVDLDQVNVGDRVGVVRRSNGSVHFIVNDVDQGVAIINSPKTLYVVVDLYGKCDQISLNETVSCDILEASLFCGSESSSLNFTPQSSCGGELHQLKVSPSSSVLSNLSTSAGWLRGSMDTSSTTTPLVSMVNESSMDEDIPAVQLSPSLQPEPGDNAATAMSSDPLRFHSHCGSNIRLDADSVTAEKAYASSDLRSGKLMSHRPLKDNEIFEITVDALVGELGGVLKIGISSYGPNEFVFCESMTHVRLGTIMLDAYGILAYGARTTIFYAYGVLNNLRVGDTVGVARLTGGAVHFFVNGVDQGFAATDISEGVYGAVDLSGRAVRVSIVSPSRIHTPSASIGDVLNSQANTSLPRELLNHERSGMNRASGSTRTLCFATTDSVAFSTDLQTATFVSSSAVQSATLLSEQPLLLGEVFYMRLVALPMGAHVSIGVSARVPFAEDAGSAPKITPGLVSHENGLWFFPSRGVTLDGELIDSNYARGVASQLKKGDRIGVVVSHEGAVHFYVNERDLGVAFKAMQLPFWGVGAMLLAGPPPQTCIVNLIQPEQDLLPDLPSDWLRFRTVRQYSGPILLNGGLTAILFDPQEDLSLGILTSNRCLKDNEMFEIVVEENEGTGSLDVGVTDTFPDHLSVAMAVSNKIPGAWMLSGSTVVSAGSTVSGASNASDLLRVGTRIGVQRRDDGTLHFFIDGRDMGAAYSEMPLQLWALIDTYGLYARLSVVYFAQRNALISSEADNENACHEAESTAIQEPPALNALTTKENNGHQPLKNASSVDSTSGNQCHLNSVCGHNVVLRNDARAACRVLGFDNGLLFSSGLLDLDDLFEVQIEQVNMSVLTGSVIVGLTTFNPGSCSNVMPYMSYEDLLKDCQHVTFLLVGRKVFSNLALLRDNYGSVRFARATVGERIGVEHCSDGTMHVYLNGEDQGVAAQNLPRSMWAVFDLFGAVESISLCSGSYVPSRRTPNCYNLTVPTEPEQQAEGAYCFSETLHGSNIKVSSNGFCAERTSSFNDALVFSASPLSFGKPFTVYIRRLNLSTWESSLSVGIIGEPPSVRSAVPQSSLEFSKLCWLVVGNSVYVNGQKVKANYGPNLDLLKEQTSIGVLLDLNNGMHLIVNGVDQGIACEDVYATRCYALFELYGRCEKLEVLADCEVPSRSAVCALAIEAPEKAHFDDNHGYKESFQGLRTVSVDRIRSALSTCQQHQAALYFLRNILCLPWYLVEHQQCTCASCVLLGSATCETKLLNKCSVFTLKHHPKNLQSWDTTFGLEIPLGAIRKCIDHGRLLARLECGLAPVICGGVGSKHHDVKASASLLRTTPSLRYALTKAPSYGLKLPGSSLRRMVRVVLQALICPDAYQKMVLEDNALNGAGVTFAQQEKLEEWHTKEKSATVVHAVVVYFD